MDNYEEEVVEETTTEETEPKVEEVEDEEVEDTTDWKAEAEKEKEARLKAERAIEQAKKKGKNTPATNGLSAQDLIALTKANIESDDLDEVLDYASYKKIGIAEALNSSILKATLAEKAEHRKSAQVVNTGSTRRANGAVTDERLLADARTGKMPESEADIAKLVLARLSKK